jgi:hypothetical protein
MVRGLGNGAIDHSQLIIILAIMQKLSKNEKMWLIFFALILFGLIGGCMYDTVTSHKPIGPRPTIKQDVQP